MSLLREKQHGYKEEINKHSEENENVLKEKNKLKHIMKIYKRNAEFG